MCVCVCVYLSQTQAVQSVEVGGDVNMAPRLAILLGAVGLGLSSYSSRQLTIHHKPCQRTLLLRASNMGNTAGKNKFYSQAKEDLSNTIIARYINFKEYI
uniref:Uncharacterized protein n=1 Tax=Astyanax mexicanus TaxID=7994 RepID=A0A3B1K232_ASTMX